MVGGGASSFRTLTVTNSSSQVVHLLEASVDSPELSCTPDFSTLSPGASGRIVVTFRAGRRSVVQGSVSLRFDVTTLRLPVIARVNDDPIGDSDGDGILDDADNCPLVPNPDQLDSDGTGVFVEEPIDGPWGAGRDVALADIDLDGLLDVVDAGLFNPPTWSKNQGAGRRIGPQVPIGVEGARAVAAGDINRDGYPDAAFIGNGVTWYPNEHGRFGERHLIAHVSSPRPAYSSIALADLDGDGDLDVATAGDGAYGIRWYENLDGAGTFALPRAVTPPIESVASLATADIDGDSDVDLLVSIKDDQTLAWYENLDAAGTFSGARVIAQQFYAVTDAWPADFDGDHDLDVIAVSTASGVVWFENLDGHGNFGSPHPILQINGVGYTNDRPRVRAGDIDGDGDLDAVVAVDGMRWFENLDGHGTFPYRPPDYSINPDTESLAVGDIDHDGDVDVVSAHGYTIEVPLLLFENTGGHEPLTQRTIIETRALQAPSAGDIDGDGRTDILATDGYSARKFTRSSSAAPTFDDYDVIEHAPIHLLMDADGDGDLDGVGPGSSSGQLALYPNQDGHGNFGPPIPIVQTDPAPSEPITADVDLDGDPDLVSASGEFPFVAINPGTTGPWTSFTLTRVPALRTMDVGDLDGDGDPDIGFGARRYPDYEIGWLENPGVPGQPWPSHRISELGVGSTSVHLTDLDGDGRIDVLVSGDPEGRSHPMFWYRSLGAGAFAAQQTLAILYGQSSDIQSADLDGDGRTDVIASVFVPSNDPSRLVWFRNEGSTLGPERLLHMSRGQARPGLVVPADANDDGRMDLIVLDPERLLWLRNTTEGVGDACDNCPELFDPSQADADRDGIGDSCDPCTDRDGDGFGDPGFPASTCPVDTCSLLPESSQRDDDGVAFDDEPRMVAAPDLYASPYPHGTADFDGDGDIDVLYTFDAQGALGWAENRDGYGSFGASHPIAPEIYALDAVPFDVDRDGDMDVIASAGDSIVWIENRDGQGTLDVQHPSGATENPMWVIELADVDVDGDMDVVSDRVWYENLDGHGAFAPAGTIASATSSYVPYVAVGDVDGDGDPDVVGSGPAAGDLVWYENLAPSANFGAARPIAPGYFEGARLADFDMDGDLDVVATYYQYPEGSGVFWIANLDGHGAFSEPRLIEAGYHDLGVIEAKDLDGDSDPDVIASRVELYSVVDGLSWYENVNGAGSFAPFQPLVNVRSAPEFADVDGDGDEDILTHYSSWVAWFRRGDGVGDACDICPAQPDDGQADHDRDGVGDACDTCTDFDRDGFSDPGFPASVCPLDDCPYVANPSQSDRDADGKGDACDDCPLGIDADGDGDCDAVDNCPTVRDGTQQDTDADGLGDVCDNCRSTPNVDQADFDGLGYYGPERLVGTFDTFGIVTVVDLEGDGDRDFVTLTNSSTVLSCFLNSDGAGTFSRTPPVPSGLYFTLPPQPADLDGDGDPDLLVAAFGFNSPGQYSWLENLGGSCSFGPPRYIALVDGPGPTYPADVDGDGRVDFITTNHIVPFPVWYQNLDAAGTFSDLIPVTTDELSPLQILVADVNGDARPDVLVVVSGKIIWYSNEGGAFGAQQLIHALDDDVDSVSVGDIDGDGDLDVLFRTLSGTRDFSWVANRDGLGTFEANARFIVHGLDLGEGVLEDLDDDGRPDLVFGDEDGLPGPDHTHGWFRNLGSGAFSNRRSLGAADAPGFNLESAELDGRAGKELYASTFASSPYGLVWFPNGAGDGVGDACDNCGLINPDQTDLDGSGIGDLCEPCIDPDHDEVGTPGDAGHCGPDNCPTTSNPDQADTDHDGVGDVCDSCPNYPGTSDWDGDGVGDACDNCIYTPNPDQADADHDGYGDACDEAPRPALRTLTPAR